MATPHKEIATLLCARVRESGLRILCGGEPPALPEGWGYNLSANGHVHACDQHRLVELPLILVMDVQVEEPPLEEGGDTLLWQAVERFAPYWLVGARVIHDWVPYPPEPFRAVNPIEAACIFAQHPYLGSENPI